MENLCEIDTCLGLGQKNLKISNIDDKCRIIVKVERINFRKGNEDE